MKDYWDALDRLLKGRPERVPRGTELSNDAVSLEAGRGKGTIKNSRSCFDKLIAAIKEARAAQRKPATSDEERVAVLARRVADLQAQLDAAHAREMSLVYELYETKKKMAELTGLTVMPIRSHSKQGPPATVSSYPWERDSTEN
jgi:hypothetical protein